jgi:hypothetical protein
VVWCGVVWCGVGVGVGVWLVTGERDMGGLCLVGGAALQ